MRERGPATADLRGARALNYSLTDATRGAFAGKTVLITGSAGFLGQHFTAALQDAGAEVVGADLLLGQDVTTRFDLPKPCRPDYIIHAAGIASPYYYNARPLVALNAAVTGTRNMLNMAESLGARLLFLSSSEIYGDPDAANVPTRETYRGNVSCTGPRACYDESKRLGETLVSIYAKRGVQALTVRPFNFYGPGMKHDDYRVLPNWRNQIRAGEPLKIYGNGEQTRTFCYVTDGIRGCLEALAFGTPGEPYNIGADGPEVSMLELADMLGQATGKPLDFVRIPHPESYPSDEPNRRCPDITKAALSFGFRPVVELADGLRAFMDSDR